MLHPFGGTPHAHLSPGPSTPGHHHVVPFSQCNGHLTIQVLIRCIITLYISFNLTGKVNKNVFYQNKSFPYHEINYMFNIIDFNTFILHLPVLSV